MKSLQQVAPPERRQDRQPDDGEHAAAGFGNGRHGDVVKRAVEAAFFAYRRDARKAWRQRRTSEALVIDVVHVQQLTPTWHVVCTGVENIANDLELQKVASVEIGQGAVGCPVPGSR